MILSLWNDFMKYFSKNNSALSLNNHNFIFFQKFNYCQMYTIYPYILHN